MGVFKNIQHLVLASASPRRKELLGTLGIEFEVVPATEEAIARNGEAPADYASRAAKEKAESVLEQLNNTGYTPEPVIMAADTIVVLDKEILCKPKSHAQAFEMLQKLSGREHTVFTACSLLLPDGKAEELLVQSQVCFASFSPAILKSYADTEEPMDKAGAYAIQGKGAFLIKRITGSWSSVVGLPVSEVTELLLAHEVICLK